MAITREEMDSIFKECNKFFEEIDEMDSRKLNAIDSIAELQEEIQKLKEQRPALLADGKSVAKINKRLKKIEEEIELNQDLIKGITEKKKNLEIAIHNARNKKQNAFQNYIKGIKCKVAKEYMEIAPKFAELVRDYILLESMYYGSDRIYVSNIPYDDIKRIPSLYDEQPLFEHNIYDLYINYDDVVKEKYNIPNYEVHRIR